MAGLLQRLKRRKTKAQIFSLILLSALACVPCVFVIRGLSIPGEPKGWGGGEPKASEVGYYRARIRRIIREWQETRWTDHDRNGRLIEAYDVHLVIDTQKGAVWIEEDGRIQKKRYSPLPRNMTWTLYRHAPEGNEELVGLLRFKIRGFIDPYPEGFFLVGRGRGDGHIAFHFDSSGLGGGGYGSQPFQLKAYGPVSESTQDCCESILVRDEEFQRRHTPVPDSGSKTERDRDEQTREVDTLGDNLVRWLKVEKKLYSELEHQVARKGFELRYIGIDPGPDYSAGHGEFGVLREGSSLPFFPAKGDSYGDRVPKIDHLESDIWYVKEDISLALRSRKEPMDLEFLVRAAGDVPRFEKDEWLRKGRRIQSYVSPKVPQKYVANLTIGATVEFIGLCEYPSAGRQWWGPDGTLLREVPLYHGEERGPGFQIPDGKRGFVIAWRVNCSGDMNEGGTAMFDGCVAKYERRPRDRYGIKIPQMENKVCVFDASRERTTLWLEVQSSNQEAWSVTFENISFVPGKDFGFRIVK